MKPIITLKIPMLAPSLNFFYSTNVHWAERNRLKDEWHMAVLCVCRKAKVKPITEYPVAIITTRFSKTKRLLDSSNCAMANKFAEDGLVNAGILVNDTTQYVAFSGQEKHEGGCDNDETVIKIYDYLQWQDRFKG